MKSRNKTKKRTNTKKTSWRFLVLLPVIGVTLFLLTQKQQLLQFAQTYSVPPLFGCIHVGEAGAENCASKQATPISYTLKLHGRPVKEDDVVYYGDTLTGTFSYRNTGDLPIKVKNYGIAAGNLQQFYVDVFSPLQGKANLNPGQNISMGTASHKFGTDDPNGRWVVGPGVTDTNNQHLPIETNNASHIVVNATCTALRVKELTAQDKSHIQSLCAKNPNGKLCTSKQYCQIFKGGNCPQKELSPEISGQQCDTNVVLAQGEQDALEELCKVYPDTDACKDFCKRSIGAKICPKVVLWFDNKTHKQVFPKPAKYMAEAIPTKDNLIVDKGEVAGIAIMADRVLIADASGDYLRGYCGQAGLPPCNPAAPETKGSPNYTPPHAKLAQPNTPGYTPKPSCVSHRQNDTGQCCSSAYPLINGCCQPGCFVYHHEDLSRGNCPYKNKSGACCSQEAVERLGYCQASQAPPGASSDPITATNPRDPRIFPPGALPPASQPGPGQCDGPSGPGPCGRGTPGGVGAPAPVNPAPAHPANPPAQAQPAPVAPPAGGSTLDPNPDSCARIGYDYDPAANSCVPKPANGARTPDLGCTNSLPYRLPGGGCAALDPHRVICQRIVDGSATRCDVNNPAGCSCE